MGLIREERAANAPSNRGKAVIPWGDGPLREMCRELIQRGRNGEAVHAHRPLAGVRTVWADEKPIALDDDGPSDGGHAA